MPVVLTADGGMNTALMELLLLIITIALAVIGYFLREVKTYLEAEIQSAKAERSQNGEQIDDHSYMLYGSDTDTWDGVYTEVKKNRRGLNQHREVLDQHGERVDKHGAALRREDMIGPEPPREDAPTADDLAEFDRIGSGGDD
jgi:hypothetical protein